MQWGLGKVGTRTLTIQKKKWRGGMFDPRRPESASHRIHRMTEPPNKVKEKKSGV